MPSVGTTGGYPLVVALCWGGEGRDCQFGVHSLVRIKTLGSRDPRWQGAAVTYGADPFDTLDIPIVGRLQVS